MFNLKKWGVLALSLGLTATAFGRVGPVSQYGQLQAGKVSGKGGIYGSCKGVTSGNEVQVQGMSLFWSISSDVGSPFWNDTYVSGLVSRQGIQLIRAPMGVDENWGSGNYFTDKTKYQGMMDAVVQSAINNDIYVIIDYHSHKATDNVNNAKDFFGYMAQKWGKYDNVIFEVFNEPTSQSWSDIKSYAESVISVIRQYSDNLVLVGNRNWDQHPNDAIGNAINDKNVAYTFHFYAGSHSTGGEGSNAVSAINAGLPVFVSEWGTVNADGGGGVSGSSAGWIAWMNQYKLSGANWSVSNKAEGASYFSGSAWNYSESGKWVNENVFGKLPKSYTACSGGSTPSTPASSASVASSSSVALPAGFTDYIDDFEDGDSLAFTGGIWYAYTDKNDKGASSLTNTPNKDAKGEPGYDVVIKGDNNTKGMGALTGVKLSQGQNPYDPYVALGVKLNADETAYDLSKCSSISYKYKGAEHNFKAEDTGVKDYAYHQTFVSASNSWTPVVIEWGDLMQPTWTDNSVALSKTRINKFTWEIKAKQPALNYLYIDDVRCNGLPIKPVVVKPASSSSAKSSSSTVSSSSQKQSSSSAKSSSSTASSSSQKQSSSSAVASSSSVAAKLEISGNLTQTLSRNDPIAPIVITGITEFNRDWGIYFLDMPQNPTAGKITIAGSVPDYMQVGTYTETLKINGESIVIKINVVPVIVVSSSSAEANSSSAVVPASSSAEANSSSAVVPASSSAEANSSSAVVPASSSAEANSSSAVVPASSSAEANSSSAETPVTSSAEANSSSAETPVTSSAEANSSSAETPVTSSAEANSSSAETPVTSSAEANSSSAVVPASSSAGFKLSGSLNQTLDKGAEIEPITATGVTSFSRDSWSMYFLEASVVDGFLVISGTVPEYFQSGTFTEKFTVNGQSVVLSASISDKVISVSSSSATSSPSEDSSASEDMDKYEVSGNLVQTVVQGAEIQTVVISGIKSYTRNSWNINFVTIPNNEANGKVVISGTALSWAQPGSYEENLTVNGEKVVFKLNVVAPASSDSDAESSDSSDSAESTDSSDSTESSDSSASEDSSDSGESSDSSDSADDSSSSESDDVDSSSSEVDAGSSSDAAVPGSSSDVQPGSSSDAVVPGSSADGDVPGSSADAVIPGDSSSSVTDPLSIASAAKPSFGMGFAHNALTVYSAKSATFKIQVFDMMGNAVMNTVEDVAGSFSLNMDNLTRGNYLVRVSTGSMVRTSRVSIR